MGTGTTTSPDGQDLTDKAQQKAQDVLGQAQAKAEEATGQVRRSLREQVDQRTTQAAEQIGQQGSDLRTVSQALRDQGKEGPAHAADTLAEYVEKAGGYLKNKDADSLLHDLEQLGRRQPWALGLGGLALGFAASRFLKASSARRYSTHTGGYSAPRTQAPPQWNTTPPTPATPAVPPTPAVRPTGVTEPFTPPVTGPAVPPGVPSRDGF